MVDYVLAEFTQLLAAFDCKPHLNIGYLSILDASAPFAYSCVNRLIDNAVINDVYTTSCLLFTVIPPVEDVHVMLKKIECERRVWSAKRSQGKTERQPLYQWFPK